MDFNALISFLRLKFEQCISIRLVFVPYILQIGAVVKLSGSPTDFQCLTWWEREEGEPKFPIFRLSRLSIFLQHCFFNKFWNQICLCSSLIFLHPIRCGGVGVPGSEGSMWANMLLARTQATHCQTMKAIQGNSLKLMQKKSTNKQCSWNSKKDGVQYIKSRLISLKLIKC